MHKKNQRLLLGNANTVLKNKYIMAVPVIQIVSFTHPPLISHHSMSFFNPKYSLNCREQHSVIYSSFILETESSGSSKTLHVEFLLLQPLAEP